MNAPIRGHPDGVRAAFTIQRSAQGFDVTQTATGERDFVESVEFFAFADITIPVDQLV